MISESILLPLFVMTEIDFSTNLNFFSFTVLVSADDAVLLSRNPGSHVSVTVFSCFTVLRQIRSIRRSVSQQLGSTVADGVAGINTPRLRQCNAGRCNSQPTRPTSVHLLLSVVFLYGL